MAREKKDILQGTLALLILQCLSRSPMHGFGLAQDLKRRSQGAFQVNPGSLFPALHRLEQGGWIAGEWGRSDNGRRAKFYRLTPSGRRRLGEERRSWRQMVSTVEQVLQTS